MTEQQADNATPADCQAVLEAHFQRHGTIPSMAGLAKLWGYASKSSAARRVTALIADGVLEWSPDRRLRPGPAFDGTSKTQSAPESFQRRATRPDDDRIDDAVESWASDYPPELVRSYAMTARVMRLAKTMETHLGNSAATEGLTVGEVLLLDTLFRVGPPHRLAPTALKKHFLISLAGVAKRVDRLDTLGMVERLANPDDKRGSFVQLSEKGLATLARLTEMDRSAPYIMWPATLSDNEYRIMLEGLKKAQAVMDSSYTSD